MNQGALQDRPSVAQRLYFYTLGDRIDRKYGAWASETVVTLRWILAKVLWVWLHATVMVIVAAAITDIPIIDLWPYMAVGYIASLAGLLAGWPARRRKIVRELESDEPRPSEPLTSIALHLIGSAAFAAFLVLLVRYFK